MAYRYGERKTKENAILQDINQMKQLKHFWSIATENINLAD